MIIKNGVDGEAGLWVILGRAFILPAFNSDDLTITDQDNHQKPRFGLLKDHNKLVKVEYISQKNLAERENMHWVYYGMDILADEDELESLEVRAWDEQTGNPIHGLFYKKRDKSIHLECISREALEARRLHFLVQSYTSKTISKMSLKNLILSTTEFQNRIQVSIELRGKTIQIELISHEILSLRQQGSWVIAGTTKLVNEELFNENWELVAFAENGNPIKAQIKNANDLINIEFITKLSLKERIANLRYPILATAVDKPILSLPASELSTIDYTSSISESEPQVWVYCYTGRRVEDKLAKTLLPTLVYGRVMTTEGEESVELISQKLQQIRAKKYWVYLNTPILVNMNIFEKYLNYHQVDESQCFTKAELIVNDQEIMVEFINEDELTHRQQHPNLCRRYVWFKSGSKVPILIDSLLNEPEVKPLVWVYSYTGTCVEEELVKKLRESNLNSSYGTVETTKGVASVELISEELQKIRANKHWVFANTAILVNMNFFERDLCCYFFDENQCFIRAELLMHGRKIMVEFISENEFDCRKITQNGFVWVKKGTTEFVNETDLELVAGFQENQSPIGFFVQGNKLEEAEYIKLPRPLPPLRMNPQIRYHKWVKQYTGDIVLITSEIKITCYSDNKPVLGTLCGIRLENISQRDLFFRKGKLWVIAGTSDKVDIANLLNYIEHIEYDKYGCFIGATIRKDSRITKLEFISQLELSFRLSQKRKRKAPDGDREPLFEQNYTSSQRFSVFSRDPSKDAVPSSSKSTAPSP